MRSRKNKASKVVNKSSRNRTWS